MGKSEYAFAVRNEEKIREILECVKKHNNCKDPRLVGEEITFGPILSFLGVSFWCLHNSGGREETTKWFENNLSKWALDRYLPPFQKPDGWFDCENYIWEPADEKDVMAIYNYEDRVDNVIKAVSEYWSAKIPYKSK